MTAPAGAPTQGAPAGQPSGDQGQPGNQPQGQPGRTFTQEDVNGFVAEERRKIESRFANHDELAEKARKFDEAQAANQTELEKAQTKAAEHEKIATAAVERANKVARESAIVLEAVKAGATHPQDIAALLGSDAVTVDKDGNVTGAQAAVEKFKTERPEYFTPQTSARPPGAPAHGLGTRTAADPPPGSLGKAEAERRFGKKQ